MDEIDEALLNILQMEFPLSLKPFDAIGRRLGITGTETIERIRQFKEARVIRQISAIFDSKALGYSSVLVAVKVNPTRRDEAAAAINQHPGVSHNYARDDDYNLWFTLTVPTGVDLKAEVKRLTAEADVNEYLLLPTIRLFKIGVTFDMSNSEKRATAIAGQTTQTTAQPLSNDDIKTVRALQDDLPLETRPFKQLAERFDTTEDLLLDRTRSLIERGIMRRFAATLRHREAGFHANAMGVWIVPDERIEVVGALMAQFPSVSHCYQRPTYPDWPYSIFTMIHGRTMEECESVAHKISEATGVTDYRLLFSVKEYKKIRVKYF